MAKGKLNRAEKLFLAAGTTFGVTLIGILASVGVTIERNNAIYRLADKNGYQEANAIYRQSEIEKLNEQLRLQEITPKQYNSQIETIKDKELSVEYYLTSDGVSQQTQEEFASLKNDYDTCKYTGGASAAIMIGSIITFAVLIGKENQYEQKAQAQDASDEKAAQ